MNQISLDQSTLCQLPLNQSVIPTHFKLIHEKALALTSTYKQSESDLLSIIIQVRDHKIYRYFDCTSVFEYCVKILKLDPGVVYGFTAVAKKIKEVPELKEKIESGILNVSTAKRITSVITSENKSEWFEKAETLTARKLEKEIAKINPKAEAKERTSYISENRLRLELGLDEKTMKKLRRVQDLESQKRQRSISLEDVILVMSQLYLTKNDPVEVAHRNQARKAQVGQAHVSKTSPSQSEQSQLRKNHVANPSTWKDFNLRHNRFNQNHRVQKNRTSIPKEIIHQLNLRDKGECQFVNSQTKETCRSSRFLHFHHRKPINAGGRHELQNLITLCSGHHKIEHLLLT